MFHLFLIIIVINLQNLQEQHVTEKKEEQLASKLRSMPNFWYYTKSEEASECEGLRENGISFFLVKENGISMWQKKYET